MKTGKVKWYNSKKHFGFVTSDDGEDIFLHSSDLPPGIELKEGDKVEFEVGEAPKGQKAINVKKAVKIACYRATKFLISLNQCVII